MASKRVVVEFEGGVCTVELTGTDTVLVEASDGAAVQAHLTRAGTDDGLYRVTIGDRSHRVYVAGPSQNRWMFCDGRVFRATVESEARTRSARPTIHGDSLAAPMPATVVGIAVERGQRVSRGETLLMLEAMKMELPIRAPRDGLVAAINCREGDLVQPGVSLLDLAEEA